MIPKELKITPTSGEGSAIVNVTNNIEHTGRNIKTLFLTWKAEDLQDTISEVKITGKKEFVDIEEQSIVDNKGKTITIKGISNSPKLTFSLGEGDLNIDLPFHYYINDTIITNGINIPNDPGALSEYEFNINIVIPENKEVKRFRRILNVTDSLGNTSNCLIILEKSDPYIILNTNIIELNYKGSAIVKTVNSNVNWIIE